jgi:hypothetical protein
MFVVIGLGVAGTLFGVVVFLLNGDADYQGGPTTTTWPLAVLILLISIPVLVVGIRGLRRLPSRAALLHLVGGLAAGALVFVALLNR